MITFVVVVTMVTAVAVAVAAATTKVLSLIADAQTVYIIPTSEVIVISCNSAANLLYDAIQ